MSLSLSLSLHMLRMGCQPVQQAPELHHQLHLPLVLVLHRPDCGCSLSTNRRCRPHRSNGGWAALGPARLGRVSLSLSPSLPPSLHPSLSLVRARARVCVRARVWCVCVYDSDSAFAQVSLSFTPTWRSLTSPAGGHAWLSCRSAGFRPVRTTRSCGRSAGMRSVARSVWRILPRTVRPNCWRRPATCRRIRIQSAAARRCKRCVLRFCGERAPVRQRSVSTERHRETQRGTERARTQRDTQRDTQRSTQRASPNLWALRYHTPRSWPRRRRSRPLLWPPLLQFKSGP